MDENVKMEIDGFYECVELMHDEEKDITVQFSNIDGPGSECVCIGIGDTNYSVYGIAEILRDKESDLVEDQVMMSKVMKAQDERTDHYEKLMRIMGEAYVHLHASYPESVVENYISDGEDQDGVEYWLKFDRKDGHCDVTALDVDLRTYMECLHQSDLVDMLALVVRS